MQAHYQNERYRLMFLIIKGDQAVLQTRPSAKSIMMMDRMEGPRRWLKAGGLSFKPTGMNLRQVQETFPDVDIQREDAKKNDEFFFEAPKERKLYVPKTKPRERQAAALEKMLGKTAFALFMEQGTGKTKVAIDHACRLYCEGLIDGVLIIAPKGVQSQWIEAQLPIHCGEPYVGISWPFKNANGFWEAQDKLRFFATTWDAIKTSTGKATVDQFIKEIGKDRLLIVADESHKIKNDTTATHKTAIEIAKGVSAKLILTGTPIASDLTDEWAQFKFLDERIIGIRYKGAFRNEFCIMGGFEGKQVMGNKNIERFKELVDPYTFRSTRFDDGMQPPTHTPWFFELTKRQKAMIREIKKELIVKIDNGEVTDAANAAVAFMRAQQISNGFAVVEDGEAQTLVDFLPHAENPRLQALQAVADNREGKIVIWTRFRHDVDLITQLLGTANCVAYVGGMKDSERKSALENFINGDARFFVSNPKTGGTGIDGLQKVCNVDVFYSNDDNSIERKQAEARIERMGSSGSVEHIDLIAKGGEDMKIIARHRKKKLLSEMALGDIRSMIAADLEDDERVDLTLFTEDANADEWES